MRSIDFSSARLLVIGDVMVDRYVEGRVERISPEAPVPVVRHARERSVAGAAANVAINAAAVGAAVRLVAPIGADAAGRELTELVSGQGVVFDPVADPSRCTTVKTRILAGSHQLVRVDREDTGPLRGETERRLIDLACAAISDADVVILSDYAKGCLTDAVVAAVVAMAAPRGVPVLVDPKRRDYAGYRGVTLIKPNRLELSLATGVPCDSDDSIEQAAQAAFRTTGAAVLVTRSERGMSLFRDGEQPIHVPTMVREVFDVSGAGDTVMALLGVGLAAGMPVGEAMDVANHAAGIVVSKLGTAAPTLDELRDSMGEDRSSRPAAERIFTHAGLLAFRQACAQKQLSVGFTNGCFDLLHPGHVRLLAGAAAQCDRLIVALNTDASVRRLKGPTRPVQGEDDRAQVMAAIGGVAAVTLFDEDTPLELIRLIKPDVLIKGSDYAERDIVGGELVKSWGGSVARIDLVPGRSTSGLIARSNAGAA